MKIKDVLNELKKWAPLEYSEDFDNVGLLVGNEENRLSKCLISHDVTAVSYTHLTLPTKA